MCFENGHLYMAIDRKLHYQADDDHSGLFMCTVIHFMHMHLQYSIIQEKRACIQNVGGSHDQLEQRP